MDKTYTWTIDVEGDWGGRSNFTDGLDKGLPIIFKLLKERNIKGLFFVSTEVLDQRLSLVQDIINEGHEVGNHGHFHIKYKENWRSNQDRSIAENIIRNWSEKEYHEYRAPKFNYEVHGHHYSYREGHLGLLKAMWFNKKPKGDEIFYLHPFDIVGGTTPPNLFCRLWYSKPRRALETLTRWLDTWPGDIRLTEVEKEG